MKKKWMAIFLTLVLGIGLSACGKSDEPTDAKDGLADSYWVCTAWVMDGEPLDEDTLKSFDITEKDLENMMMLHFNDDQTVTWMMMQNFDDEGNEVNQMIGETVPYEESEEGIKMTLMELDAFLEFQDDKLYYGSEEANMGYLLSRVDEKPDAFDENPEIAFHISFSEEETVAMSAFMRFGIYFSEGQTLYGRFFGESSRESTLSKMEYTIDDSGKIEQKAPVLLDDSCSASYITQDGDWLYYRRYDCGTEDYVVCRIHDDGSGKDVIYDEYVDYMQIHEGRIWFCNDKYQFCSMTLEGKDVRVEFDQEIYYPYFVEGDWMICQVDADNESLHLINIEKGLDRKLTDVPSHSPVVVGSDVFFFIDDTDEQQHLAKLSLTTLEMEQSNNTFTKWFTTNGKNIYIDSEEGYLYDRPVEEYQQLKNNIEEGAAYNSIPYANGDIYIEYSYSEGAKSAEIFLRYRDTGKTLNHVPGA